MLYRYEGSCIKIAMLKKRVSKSSEFHSHETTQLNT